MPRSSPAMVLNLSVNSMWWEKPVVNRTDLNRYALLAQQMWSANAPQAVAQMSEPMEFFHAVGVNAQAQIEAMVEQMSQSVPVDAAYLDKIGQWRVIRKQAEEKVLNDLVYEPVAQAQAQAQRSETGSDPLQELEELQSEAPTPEAVRQRLAAIRDEAERQAELEGWPEVIFSDSDRQQMDWLLQVLTLVTLNPEQMSAPAAQQASNQLRSMLAQRP